MGKKAKLTYIFTNKNEPSKAAIDNLNRILYNYIIDYGFIDKDVSKESNTPKTA